MSNSQNSPDARIDPNAADALLPIVYDELHRIAKRYMSAERDAHTLQTTALVNEAYLSLMQGAGGQIRYADENHFLAVAARAMRRILINHAVAKKTQKRTIAIECIQSDALTECFAERCIDLIALDEAMKQLEGLDATQAKIVELRFFAGVTVPQCAAMLGLSERTVHYEWSHARAWLKRSLEDK